MDIYAVDLHAAFGSDKNIFCAVDDPRLNKIAPFRIDLDHYIRRLYLKLAVHQIPGTKLCIDAESLAV